VHLHLVASGPLLCCTSWATARFSSDFEQACSKVLQFLAESH
jgi:hypothetical protein